VGHALRLNVNSFSLNAIFEYQHHHRPFPGAPPTPADPPDQPNALPGAPDNTEGRGFIGATEIIYVLFPWLAPGIRAEYTLLNGGLRDGKWGRGSLLRVLPGVAVLLRPNMRLYLVGDIEHAYRLPPVSALYSSSWANAGGIVTPNAGSSSKTEVEQITATLAWAL
jgi:hypothetical protein